MFPGTQLDSTRLPKSCPGIVLSLFSGRLLEGPSCMTNWHIEAKKQLSQPYWMIPLSVLTLIMLINAHGDRVWLLGHMLISRQVSLNVSSLQRGVPKARDVLLFYCLTGKIQD